MKTIYKTLTENFDYSKKLHLHIYMNREPRTFYTLVECDTFQTFQ